MPVQNPTFLYPHHRRLCSGQLPEYNGLRSVSVTNDHQPSNTCPGTSVVYRSNVINQLPDKQQHSVLVESGSSHFSKYTTAKSAVNKSMLQHLGCIHCQQLYSSAAGD